MIAKTGYTNSLNKLIGIGAITALALVCFTLAAPAESHKKQSEHGEHSGEGRGEHARERGGDAEGKESGAELTLKQTYDQVRNGARLKLAYDPNSNSFRGTVENTTDKTLKRVRIEVHLSNGKELGPTKPGDLKPGQKRRVQLKAKSRDFDGWTTHAEVGNEEHGRGEEGHGERERGEHDREGSGEHG